MKKISVGPEFFIASFVALICCIVLLFSINQTEKIDTLCSAIEREENDKAKEIVSEIYDLDLVGSDNVTPLMKACMVGNGEMIEYLLECGANINYAPPNQLTPLEHFCSAGYMAGHEVVKTMFKYFVKQSNYTVKPAIFHLADNYYWMTDEEKAVATEITIILLQKGAPLGYNDTTLLHIAAKSDMDDLFYTVVHSTQGLSMLNMPDGNGDTPWEVALKNGAVRVQKVIRDLESELSGRPQDPLQPILPGIEPDVDIEVDDSIINSN